MIYVQNSYGTGHLRMMLNLADELIKKHEVMVVYGGPETSFKYSQKINFQQLPGIIDDDIRKELKVIDSSYSLEYVKETRVKSILMMFEYFKPDFLIVEHFPFGRQNFRFEIMPLLDLAKQNKVNLFGSFRGIIGKNFDMEQLKSDLEYFKKIFVHTDSKVTDLKDEIDEKDFELIKNKIIYTGYLLPQNYKKSINETKKEIGNDIIVNAGSGRDVNKLIDVIIKSSLQNVKIYTGKHFEGFNELNGRDGLELVKFSDTIIDEMLSSKVIITTGGYNSVVETLLTDAKVLFVPIDSYEQEIRTKNFEKKGFGKQILMDELNVENLKVVVGNLIRGKGKEDKLSRIKISGSKFVVDFIDNSPQEIIINDNNYVNFSIKDVTSKKVRFEYYNIQNDSFKFFNQLFFQKISKKLFEVMDEAKKNEIEILDSVKSPVINHIKNITTFDYSLKKMNRDENIKLNNIEFKENKLILKSYPTNLYIEITRNCNSLCRMCARSFGPVEFKTYNEKFNMSFEFFKEIADKLFSTAKEVDLRGFGESTMLPDFEKFVDYALKFNPQYILVTNLTVKNDKLWQKLIKNNFVLGISIDSAIKETYEYIRRGSKFENLINNLELISPLINPKDEKVFFMVCVQKDNINELCDILKLAKKYNIFEVELNPVGKPEFSIKSLPKEEVKGKIIEVINLAKKLGIKLTMSGSLGFYDIEEQNGLQEKCVRPWAYTYITYDGKMGPCNHRFNPPLVFGDLKKTSFENAWNSIGFQLFRSTIHTKNRFEKCNWCYENRYY